MDKPKELVLCCNSCGVKEDSSQGTKTGYKYTCSTCTKQIDDNKKEEYKKEAFLHYLICALWSSTDDDCDPLDDNYSICDINNESMEKMRAESNSFVDSQYSILKYANVIAEQCGHDFWLTRNGHGAGFWDRGLGNAGDKLTTACEAFGSCDLMIGDDNQLYCEG